MGEWITGSQEQARLNRYGSLRLPPVSLVICSRDRPALLLDTVRSVLAGDMVPDELIIVDQSTAPLSLSSQRLERPPGCEIRSVHQPSPGASRARNTGIRLAKHPILVFLDDDMLVAPECLHRLIGRLQRAGPRAVVTGRVLAAPAEGADGFTPALVTGETPAVYRGRLPIDILASGHMAAYRQTLEAVGCFDERLGPGGEFPAAEDNDLGFRLLDAGCSIVYVPEAVVYHRAWRSTRDYLPMRWNYGRGKGGFYAKHLSLRDRYMLVRAAKDIGRRVFRFPYRLLRQRRLAYGDAVYIAGVVTGLFQWLVTRPDEGVSKSIP